MANIVQSLICVRGVEALNIQRLRGHGTCPKATHNQQRKCNKDISGVGNGKGLRKQKSVLPGVGNDDGSRKGKAIKHCLTVGGRTLALSPDLGGRDRQSRQRAQHEATQGGLKSDGMFEE